MDEGGRGTVSTGGPTLISLVSEQLGRPEWRPRLVRGAGAKPSHVARHLGARLIRARWPATEQAPREGQCLGWQQLSDAQAIWIELADDVSWGLAEHLAIVELAMQLLIDQGVECPRRLFSEPGLIAIGRHLVQRPGRPVDREELAARLARTMTDRAAAGRTGAVLDADRFFAAYHEVFLRLWERDGVAALRDYPPSRIGLGTDRCPPTVSRLERSWMDGTDRSVHARYRAYFHQSHTPVGAARLHPDAAAATELDRAAQGYGLGMAAHRTVLTSLAAAQLDPSTSRTEAGRRERQWRISGDPLPALPAGQVDTDLVLAASAKLRLWHETTPAWWLRQTHGDLTHRLNWALVRALWMDLLRQEHRSPIPIDRPTLNAAIRTALDNKIPEAVRSWAGIGQRPTRSERRLNASLEIVNGLGELARGLLGADPSAGQATYRQRAREAHGARWADRALSVEELAEYLRGFPVPEEDS